MYTVVSAGGLPREGPERRHGRPGHLRGPILILLRDCVLIIVITIVIMFMINIYIYIYTYICICICICIERERERDIKHLIVLLL